MTTECTSKMILELDTIVCAEALSWMATLPDACVDMVLCDLPYGVTGLKWDVIIPFEPMWSELKRIVKPNCAIVLTATQPFSSMLVMSNPEMFRYEWVWVKQHAKGFLDARRKPLSAHENVLIFSHKPPVYYPQGLIPVKVKSGRTKKGGNGVYGKVGNPDYMQTEGDFPQSVLCFDTVTNGTHPTEKPADLFSYLIRTYTQANDTVLDCCVGSGTTAVAARQCGRHWLCCDSSPEYVALANERMAQPWQPSLFG